MIKKYFSNNRQFGLILGAFLIYFSIDLNFFKFSIELGYIVIALSIIYPDIFNSPTRLWIKLGEYIGKYTNKIILCILFYAIFTPAGIILRALKKNYFNLKLGGNQITYWEKIEKPLKFNTLEYYKNQF
jgi:hypothetical protein